MTALSLISSMGLRLAPRGLVAAALYNFTTGTLPSGATLTRASGATRFNSAGTLVTEANNVARFDYSPVTLASRGLEYEPVAATNVLLESTPATVGNWASFGLIALTTGQPGKASATSATKLTPSASGLNSYRIRQNVTWTAATYTVSCDVKASGWTWICLFINDGVAPKAWFNIATGVKGTFQGTGITYSIENIGGGFYRLQMTATAAANAGLFEVYLSGGDGAANLNATPNGTDAVFIENIQVELGTSATSRVITTAAAATRAAEALAVTIPASTTRIRINHDDASYTEKLVSAGAYTVPLLKRSWITTINAQPTLPATFTPAGTATSFPDLIPGTLMYDLNSVTRHYFPQGADWIDIGIANAAVNLANTALAEAGPGFPMSVAASVTLPDGTIIQIPWGGAATGTVADNTVGYSDRTFVGITAGSYVLVNIWRKLVGSNLGLVNQTASDVANGEKCRAGNGDGNLSMTPSAIADNVGAGGYRTPPAIIRGNVSGRSFAIIGDSRTEGTQDAGATSDHGELTRALTNRWPYINLGIGNDRADKFVASHTLRQALATQYTDIVQAYGVNDISNARTSAQLLADNATIRGYFSGKTFWNYTLPPFGVGGTYTTLVGQTVGPNEAVRVAFNTALRAGIAGVTILEVADTIESARDSGKFRVDLGALTTDGTHENALGNSTIGTAISGSIT